LRGSFFFRKYLTTDGIQKHFVTLISVYRINISLKVVSTAYNTNMKKNFTINL